MYSKMTYTNGKPVQVGDILYHKKWNAKGQSLKMEVVKPGFFGTSLAGKLTVVLRDTNMHGFHSYQTEALPQKNGGYAFVATKDVRFGSRGTEEGSVFAPAPKKRSFNRGDHDD